MDPKLPEAPDDRFPFTREEVEAAIAGTALDTLPGRQLLSRLVGTLDLMTTMSDWERRGPPRDLPRWDKLDPSALRFSSLRQLVKVTHLRPTEINAALRAGAEFRIENAECELRTLWGVEWHGDSSDPSTPVSVVMASAAREVARVLFPGVTV